MKKEKKLSQEMNDWFLKQNEHNTNAVTTRMNVRLSARVKERAMKSRERESLKIRANESISLLCIVIIPKHRNKRKTQTNTHTQTTRQLVLREKEREKKETFERVLNITLFLREPEWTTSHSKKKSSHQCCRAEASKEESRYAREGAVHSLPLSRKTIISCNKIIHYLNFDNFF